MEQESKSIPDEQATKPNQSLALKNARAKTAVPRVVSIDVHDTTRFLAATARAVVGVLFVVVALHFLPIHMITPIMTGMGVLMITTGSYAAWQVGRSEPRLMLLARWVFWGAPIACVVTLLATSIFGAGAFSPAITDLMR